MNLPVARRAIARSIFVSALVPLLPYLVLAPPVARAQDHIVTSQALRQQVQTQSAERQQNIQTLTNFLSSPLAKRAMNTQRIDPVKIRTAIPTLSSQELANLAARAQNAQQKFSAGLIGTGMLLVIAIAIIVIIVLVAVH